jgi:putative endonuclease
MHKEYFVYILFSKSKNFYIGVTSDLSNRMIDHREQNVPGHTRRYNINRLIYVEVFEDIDGAITREKQLKGWTRAKKIALIQKSNPRLEDISDKLLPH